MMKYCSLLLLLIFNPVLIAKDYDFTAVRGTLNEYVKTGKLAGGVILVMKNGKKILHYAAGMQDIEASKEMRKDSLFRIASQTKALTSVAVMILHERGLLKLTDPVSRYLPAFNKTKVLVINDDKSHSVVPVKREITLHDLLTHSSGINYGWGSIEKQWRQAGIFGWYFADKDKTIAESLRNITSLPQQAQPGTEFVYGYSTDILGIIIEIVSGKNLAEFLKTEITIPLKMNDTHFFVPANKVDRLTAVYSAITTGIQRAPDVSATENFMHSQGHYSKGPMKAFSGGAGLISTADDYAIFLSMLENNGTFNGIKILSTTSVDMMTSNQIPYIKMNHYDGFGYGFALKIGSTGEVKGKTIEYGWGGAYHSYYLVRPEDNVVMLYLTQLIPAKGLQDWDEINVAIKTSLGIKH